jgi:hypothetical protein
MRHLSNFVRWRTLLTNLWALKYFVAYFHFLYLSCIIYVLFYYKILFLVWIVGFVTSYFQFLSLLELKNTRRYAVKNRVKETSVRNLLYRQRRVVALLICPWWYMRGGDQHHAAATSSSGKSTFGHCIVGWGESGAGVDRCGLRKISCPPPGFKPPNCPAHSESL